VKFPFILMLGAIPIAAGAVPPASPVLYEEDVLASSPIRIAQWKQMQAYADALPETVSAGRAAGVEPADDSAEALRRAFRLRLGYPAPGFLDQPAMRLEQAGEDGVATYYRCYVRVTPQMETYGLYIVPKRAVLPAPLVIAMHGGGGFPELATFHGGSNYHDLVRGAVAEGWITFAPLAVMYPYRDRDHGTPIPSDVREQLDARLNRCGTSLMGVEVTKITRSLDVLETRPEVDRRRVAMIGLSYGGFYTLYTAALDPRIRVAVASCSFRDRGPDAAPVPENLRETDVLGSVELVKLISPRPLQVQDGIGDEIFPIGDVRRAAAQASSCYPGALAGQFDFQVFAGGHEFHGDVAWPFLRKFLHPERQAQ
jgi:dienelactone hydrolase